LCAWALEVSCSCAWALDVSCLCAWVIWSLILVVVLRNCNLRLHFSELSLEVQGGQDYFRFVEGTCIIALCLSSLSLSLCFFSLVLGQWLLMTHDKRKVYVPNPINERGINCGVWWKSEWQHHWHRCWSIWLIRYQPRGGWIAFWKVFPEF